MRLRRDKQLKKLLEEFKNGFSKVALNGKSKGYIDKKGIQYWED